MSRTRRWKWSRSVIVTKTKLAKYFSQIDYQRLYLLAPNIQAAFEMRQRFS